MTGTEIAEEARTFLDTPYIHQGRLKGVGIDCVGLLIQVGKVLGFVPGEWESSTYGGVTDGTVLDAELRLWCDEIPFAVVNGALTGVQAGDIIVIDVDGSPQHTAFVFDTPDGALGMVHAALTSGRVVEHRIGGKWPRRVLKAFRVKGVA